MGNSTDKKYRLSSFSILIIFVLLIIMGISFLPLLNVQLNPSRSLPKLTVSYRWSEASARVIEQEVTSKLEGLFSAVNGIKEVSSVSSKGSGRISLSFKKTVNLDAARFEIAALIRQVYGELPEQVSFPELSMGTSGQNTQPIMTYTLNASANPWLIQKYAEDHLVPALSILPGISGVKVYGATPFEWEIKFNSDRIHTLGISSADISQSLNNYFREEYIGQGIVSELEDKEILSGLYIRNNIGDTINWQSIPIKKVEERIIQLGDIARIQYKEKEPSSYFRINGLNTINMVIYPEEGINNLRLATKIKEKIDELTTKLPAGYSLLLANDSTEYIEKELDKVFMRTFFSLIILLTFVLIVSRQVRYLFLIVSSIFANLFIACIFYYILGIEIHLYSLAGITISFGMIIDNSIIMIDHLRHQGNKKAFLAILAATLTTIGALSVVFFLKESQRINLVEFAQVIIVNLFVSMTVALFFIPALMDKVKLKVNQNRSFFCRKRRTVKISSFYLRFIRFSKRFKWVYFILFILGFGLPLQWLPERIEKDNFGAKIYNKTLGSDWYRDEAKPIAEKVLGGSLRLFSEYVFESSFYSEPQRTMLYVRGKMPEGCTVKQMNDAIVKMENFLSQFKEIELFQTSINSYNNSSISIQFTAESENGSFPYFLKEEITSKAISLGGLDWSVYGVGKGFSNSLHTGFKNSRIILEGYNYDELYKYADLLKTKLSTNDRVKEIEITGSTGWNSSSLYEYYLDFNKEGFGLNKVNVNQFYLFLKDKVYKAGLNSVYLDGELQAVSLVSDQYGEFNVWDLKYLPVDIGDKQVKLSNLAKISRQKSGNEIHKKNQQYQLVVAYDFIGPSPLSKMVRERHEEEMSELLPLGYSVRPSNNGWGWDKNDKKQYFLLVIIILIIYVICSILLESLLQPLAIILMIPVSFIGVFLTFYLFDFNFDQGGFASFVLLCGIVVNAGLYIINDYNNFKRADRKVKNLRAYIKAFNHKIIPIFLTIISTVLGLIPFVWGGQNEVFWFAFAAGAIGGLLFSVTAILVYLPLFMKLNINKSKSSYQNRKHQ